MLDSVPTSRRNASFRSAGPERGTCAEAEGPSSYGGDAAHQVACVPVLRWRATFAARSRRHARCAALCAVAFLMSSTCAIPAYASPSVGEEQQSAQQLEHQIEAKGAEAESLVLRFNQ